MHVTLNTAHARYSQQCAYTLLSTLLMHIALNTAHAPYSLLCAYTLLSTLRMHIALNTAHAPYSDACAHFSKQCACTIVTLHCAFPIVLKILCFVFHLETLPIQIKCIQFKWKRF